MPEAAGSPAAAGELDRMGTSVRRRAVSPLLASLVVVGLLAPTAPAGAAADRPVALPQGLETAPVVLTGRDLAGWAVPGTVAATPGGVGAAQCLGGRNGVPEPLASESQCTHNTFEDPVATTGGLVDGPPIEAFTGWRWDGEDWAQIPFQVDEVDQRFLSNDNSGFAFYSETDGHVTYVFDREGFRFMGQDPDDACLAAPTEPGVTMTPDAVPGLDTDDELVFMARDAGARAPSQAGLPDGITDAREVSVVDPDTGTTVGYAYVMRGDVAPAFDATSGYVRYERDADADVYEFSQSSYRDYGAAPHGAYRDPATGECVGADDSSLWRQRRPRDGATITTPRYRYRYDGRWLMTDWRVSADDDWTYGPDLVDQWKARAFQQRPGGETPCCGYEEEENNWGGSSILLGERVGPVRAIRETWGADSGTNVIRRELFYRDEVRQRNFLRVHPITPLDGIYTQWDYNAGAVSTYYNPQVPEGVAIDGRNDDALGNSRMYVGQDGVLVQDEGLRELGVDSGEVRVGEPREPTGGCAPDGACLNNDVDTADPRFSGVNQLLQWEQIAGPNGTLISRFHSEQPTPGAAAHTVAALPYYRDDACFDDGTGSNPGPHLNRRDVDEGPFAMYTRPGPDGEPVTLPRECWTPDSPEADLGTDRYFQGSIGTHGLHLLFIVDSDNAHTTLPVTEIVAEQRIVVLPPTLENVGEAYAGSPEDALVGVVAPRRPL
jgi:hypothetical protein